MFSIFTCYKKRPIQSLKPTVSPNFSSDDDPLVPETNSPEPYFDSIEPVINNLSTFSISSNKKTTTENLIFESLPLIPLSSKQPIIKTTTLSAPSKKRIKRIPESNDLVALLTAYENQFKPIEVDPIE